MHVSLRPREPTDRPLLLGWRNHPEIRRWMLDDHVIAPEEHAAWFERSGADRTRIDWVIQVDGVACGAAALIDLDVGNRRASWELYVAPDAPKGAGVGTAVEHLVAGYAFERAGLHRLACQVLATNQAALALYTHYGFTADGTLRQHVWRDDAWVDVLVLSLLEHEWPPAASRAAARLADAGIEVPAWSELRPAPPVAA